jgi:hypothetical protein
MPNVRRVVAAPAALAALAALAGLSADVAAAGAQSARGGAGGARELSVELFAGTAWSLSTPLVVRLPGRPTARLRARWQTRPLADAPYYAYRVAAARGGRAAEAELVHHKLYLANPAPPVERLEVTHGYNLATANLRAPAGRAHVRVGLGVVIAHPEGRVAGVDVGGRRTLLGGGYHVAGVTAQLAVGRRWALGRGRTAPFAAPEAKLTASLARVPLGDGSVLVPNAALHALAGLGLRTASR